MTSILQRGSLKLSADLDDIIIKDEIVTEVSTEVTDVFGSSHLVMSFSTGTHELRIFQENELLHLLVGNIQSQLPAPFSLEVFSNADTDISYIPEPTSNFSFISPSLRCIYKNIDFPPVVTSWRILKIMPNWFGTIPHKKDVVGISGNCLPFYSYLISMLCNPNVPKTCTFL